MMVQTFGMIAKYTTLKSNIEHKTLSDAVQSPPDKVSDDTSDAKKIQVHLANPNDATLIKSQTHIT
jgi:hypothetical protein